MSDTVFVSGLLIHAHHGVMEHEAKVGQRFVLDLELALDLKAAARSDKLRRHAEGRRAWVGGPSGDEAALRQWYAADVAPRLAEVARTEIARAIGVSRVYARNIARGKVPHPRHFEVLAELVGVEMAKVG